ncbi:MAG TPA: FAD-dependent oxidoreductase [Acidimicrobiales bacterium]|nr:MAG: hypothetical protein B7Z69_02250 [Actinobacteria bacterium 21-73-9]HQU25785.1 FAD-dependent oxidoreductase [Acidimicrobiales bacterium]
MRIAIVGTGVAGLTCAHLLHPHHEVTVFEAAPRSGGHAHTHDLEVGGSRVSVDTGFIVYNERNYPLLTRLFAELGVATRPSDMGFSVTDERAGVEWSGSSIGALLAQPRNALRPGFWRMLSDVARFNREARTLLEGGDDDLTLAEYLESSFSREFRDWYLVPMGAAIWSADPAAFTEFPARALARFFFNHGLLGLGGRPQWRTVVGGSRTYVERVLAPLAGRVRLAEPVGKVVRRTSGVEVATDAGPSETFDHVIVATHSDQALALLSDPTSAEREVLGALRYRSNDAVLHTDQRLLPTRPRARASWNWHQGTRVTGPTLTYDLSRLQGLDTPEPLLLTLNRTDAVDPARVIAETRYDHPVYDGAALRAQRRHREISGVDGVSFAGAYWGYGFHEDGARSAVAVCETLGVTWPEARP